MNIKKAVEHFLWKLNPKNSQWKATDKDVEAINGIMTFVNQKHKQQLNENQLFAKLYINYYAELLKYYKSTVSDREAQKELHILLELELCIICFVMKLFICWFILIDKLMFVMCLYLFKLLDNWN